MSSPDQTPFDAYSERVERPLTRLFFAYGLERIQWYLAGMAGNFVAQMGRIIPPLLLGTAIDSIFLGEAAFSLPLVPDSWLPTEPMAQFWLTMVLIATSFVVAGVATWFFFVKSNVFAQGVMHEVRVDCFAKMQQLDMSFFDDKQTGEVMAILNNDTQNLEMFLDTALMNLVRILIMVGGIAAILVHLNWQLAIVTLLVVPAMVAFTWWFMGVVEPRYITHRSTVGRLNTRLENSIAGMEVTKATSSEQHELSKVWQASRQLYEDTIALIRTNAIYRPGMGALAGLSFAATFLVGGVWLATGRPPGPLDGNLSVGQFVVFLFMTQYLVSPLSEIASIVDQYENARASSQRIFGLMDVPTTVDDPDQPVELDGVEGRIEYDAVSFAYPDGTRGQPRDDADATTNVVEEVSFVAEPGETVALVGPTGAGKSTVVRLLLRLYDADEGAVRLDSHDVRELRLADLRSSIGYVSQDAFLFDGTIADNIRYGEFDASDDEIREAAKAAQVHEFVADLPDGYETRVGERGVKLSGGQQQRIALARVVLQDPEVLVLDEATSSVDAETEVAIQRSIDRLTRHRTTFVIAHRLSTIRDADAILVIEDGAIVERGTHEELLALDGRYASLWNAQMGDSQRRRTS